MFHHASYKKIPRILNNKVIQDSKDFVSHENPNSVLIERSTISKTQILRISCKT